MFVMHVYLFFSPIIVTVVRSDNLFALEKNLSLVSCVFPLCSANLISFWLHDLVVLGHARDFVELCTCSSSKQNSKIKKVCGPSSFKEISYSWEIVHSLVPGNLCSMFLPHFRVVDLILAASLFKKCLGLFVPCIFELLVESLFRLGFRVLLPST